MARKNFSHYESFLGNGEQVWVKLGAGFRLQEWDQQSVADTKQRLKELSREIEKMEATLGLLRSERDAICKQTEGLNTLLRRAVLALFPSGDPVIAGLPRLMKATAGRPNKAAAARKAATIKRKSAAAEAAKAGGT